MQQELRDGNKGEPALLQLLNDGGKRIDGLGAVPAAIMEENNRAILSSVQNPANNGI